MTWTPLAKHSSGPSTPGPAAMRWIRQPNYTNHGQRAKAALSALAVDAFYALAGDLNIAEPLGITVLLGSGDHQGHFGVVPATYTGKDNRHVYALTRESSGGRQRVFSCRELCEIQERGWSLLERTSDLLVGTLGTADPANARSKHKPPPKARIRAKETA